MFILFLILLVVFFFNILCLGELNEEIVIFEILISCFFLIFLLLKFYLSFNEVFGFCFIDKFFIFKKFEFLYLSFLIFINLRIKNLSILIKFLIFKLIFCNISLMNSLIIFLK